MDERGTRPVVVLLGAICTFLGFAAYHISPASIVPLLVTRFGITKADAGLSISVVYLGWLVFQLPSGYLIDRYDERRLMAVAAAAFVAAAVAGTATRSYAGFLLLRGIAGVTGGVLFTMNAAIVGRSFPARRRGAATSLFVASGPAGIALGNVVTPTLVAAVAPKVTIAGYAGLVVAGYALFRVGYADDLGTGAAISIEAFLSALADRDVLVLAVAAACTNALFLFLNTWMPTYAVERLALPLAAAGLLSSATPVAGMIARPAGGWISDLIDGRRRPVVLASFLLVLPPFLAAPRAGSPLAFGAALLAAGFLLQLSAGVYFVYVQELADRAVEGTSTAVLTTFVIVGGMSAPVAGGWLIEAFSWSAAFAAGAAVAVAGAAITVAVRA